MAKAKKTLKTALKWKKKKWYKVIAPKTFFESQIGETTAMDDSEPIGKTVQVNLMNLTRNIRQKNINVKFKISKVTGSLCHTELSKYQMSPSIIKRSIRHGNDRIDDSFGIITKDSRKAIIKPLMVTKKTTKNSVLTAIRKTGKTHVINLAKSLTLSELINDVVKGRVQKDMYMKLSKIYPLKSVHIRVFKILDLDSRENPVAEEETKESADDSKSNKEIEPVAKSKISEEIVKEKEPVVEDAVKDNKKTEPVDSKKEKSEKPKTESDDSKVE